MVTFWLVIGTIVMLAATVFFAYLGINAPSGSRLFFIITVLITLIAFIAYFSMAAGKGVVVSPGEPPLYQARYWDWLFTTPLLLIDLMLLALANPLQRIGLAGSLVGLAVLMVLIGWWASATNNPAKYILWFIAVLVLITLLYLLLTRLLWASAERPQSVRYIFRVLAVYTTILWSLYPIVWLIGTEGIGATSLSVEIFLFLILDIFSKVGFGLLLLTNRGALRDFGAASVRPSRVG